MTHVFGDSCALAIEWVRQRQIQPGDVRVHAGGPPAPGLAFHSDDELVVVGKLDPSGHEWLRRAAAKTRYPLTAVKYYWLTGL
jgi:hypothetical protein